MENGKTTGPGVEHADRADVHARQCRGSGTRAAASASRAPLSTNWSRSRSGRPCGFDEGAARIRLGADGAPPGRLHDGL